MGIKLQPFFYLYGGKYRAARYYPPPRYAELVEPFAGAAGYALHYPHLRATLIDSDPIIAGTWQYLRRVSPAELLALPDLAPGQTTDDLTTLPPEARWLIGWWLNHGATRPRKSPSAWMRAGIRPLTFWGPAVRQRLAQQVEHIRHWQVILGDYTQASDHAATWFIDPPYRQAGRHYAQGSSRLDYAALGSWCRTRTGQVLVCEQVGADWLPFVPWRETKANEAKSGGKISREALWQNDMAPVSHKPNGPPRTLPFEER